METFLPFLPVELLGEKKRDEVILVVDQIHFFLVHGHGNTAQCFWPNLVSNMLVSMLINGFLPL